MREFNTKREDRSKDQRTSSLHIDAFLNNTLESTASVSLSTFKSQNNQAMLAKVGHRESSCAKLKSSLEL